MTEVFKNNLVSIIIPVYNFDFLLLEQCINSCACQTYKNIEILIMANGVTDETYKQILYYEQTDKRIKVIRCKKKGVSNARNEGMRLSKGKYIAFIDADDYLEDNYIEKMIVPDADITACSFYKEYSFRKGKNIITKEQKPKTKEEFITDLLNFQKAVGCVWGKLFNAEYLKENNIFFDEELNLAEDADFVLRGIKYNNPKIIYIPEMLYHYTFSQHSVVRNFNEKYCESYRKALKKIEYLIDKKKYLTQWNNFVAHHLLLICVNYCFNSENRISYNGRKQILKEILKDELFAKCLNLYSLKDFPLSKKISLFFLKHGIVFVVYIISIIRNNMR